MILKTPTTVKSSRARAGATLVEVLMALLIMAIGVTSIFTLFPLAILRAVKANQLTNAKLYEGSIKDILLGNTQLWTGAPEWAENVQYGTGFYADVTPNKLWVSRRPNGKLLPDTNQIFYCAQSSPLTSTLAYPGFMVNQSLSSTTRNGGYQNRLALTPTSTDGSITWTPYRHSPYIADTSGKSSAYVVDPLGWYRAASNSDRFQFGIIQEPLERATPLYADRIHCQLSSDNSDKLFRLQDSWSEVVETTPAIITESPIGRVQVVFPDTMDVTGLGVRNRVVLTSTLSPASLVLNVQNVANPVASTVVVDGNLPPGFQPDAARIDVQSPSRYSWLMAVHASPRGEFTAQCAVVINRTFESLDEQGYRAEFCKTEDFDGDDALDANEDTLWQNGRIDTNMAKVRWLAGAESPQIKEGGFIFDASHCYWYQIQKIEVNEQLVTASDVPDTGGTYVRSVLRLSDPVNVSTGISGDVNAFSDYLLSNDTNDCVAVIIPGVFHVFIPDP